MYKLSCISKKVTLMPALFLFVCGVQTIFLDENRMALKWYSMYNKNGIFCCDARRQMYT